jgi:hypothetical protein
MSARLLLHASIMVVVGVSCRRSEVALPGRAAHPVYHVEARLPEGWVATLGHDAIIPVDTWFLHPQGVERVGVRLMLDWQPRRGRHSSGFPGGRDGDEVPSTKTVGGASRSGELFLQRTAFRIDFDVGEVAVSVVATVGDDRDWPSIDAVLRGLRFDPNARPAVVSSARRGLDLARRWATEHGFPTDGIVSTSEDRMAPTQHFTVFHRRGLESLTITPATGSIQAQ